MPPSSAPPVVRVTPVNLVSTSLSNEVEPLQPTCHILLCSYRRARRVGRLAFTRMAEVSTHCEITHLIFSDDRDPLDIMILLDQVRKIFYSSFYFAASCYLVKIVEFAGPGSGTTSFPPVPSGDDVAQS